MASRLIYLDHAATSQKPRQVLEALQHYYSCDNANVHRGAHQLSARATDAFEAARTTTAAFVGAASPNGKSSSPAMPVRRSISWHAAWGDANLKEGDEVLLTVMEHHSNLVPWQLLAQRTGCVLRHVGITESGELDLEDFEAQLSERTRLVSLVHISNTLGCCNPLDQVIPAAHAVGALCARGCLPEPGPQTDRRGDVGCRLPGRLVPQALRPDGYGLPLGAGVPARGDASLPRWWRDDSGRLPGPQHLGGACPTSSKPGPLLSEKRWAWGLRLRLPPGRLVLEAIQAWEAQLTGHLFATGCRPLMV